MVRAPTSLPLSCSANWPCPSLIQGPFHRPIAIMGLGDSHSFAEGALEQVEPPVVSFKVEFQSFSHPERPINLQGVLAASLCFACQLGNHFHVTLILYNQLTRKTHFHVCSSWRISHTHIWTISCAHIWTISCTNICFWRISCAHIWRISCTHICFWRISCAHICRISCT